MTKEEFLKVLGKEYGKRAVKLAYIENIIENSFTPSLVNDQKFNEYINLEDEVRSGMNDLYLDIRLLARKRVSNANLEMLGNKYAYLFEPENEKHL